MVKVFIANIDYDVNGRRRVNCVLQWGGTETLNPKALGLMSVDFIVLSPQSINTASQAIAIGSVPNFLGSQDPGAGNYFYRGAGIGSTITLRWAFGSTGTRYASAHVLGTGAPGTKTAHALILGQTM